MIKVGNNTISKVYKGDSAIQKIYKGATLLWQNKIPFSTSISAPQSTNFPPILTCEYTIPNGVTITSISANASVTNHLPSGNEYAHIRCAIYINGNELIASGYAQALPTETKSVSISASGNWGVGTRITISGEGNSFNKSCGATLTGEQDG